MEFDLQEEISKCDFNKSEDRKAFRERLLDRLTFLESEAKSAFLKRDETKKAYRTLEAKINELSTKSKTDLPRTKQLEANLLEAGKKHKCINPVYLHRILRDSFQWNEEKQCFLDKEQKDIETSVSDFLNDERNDFLKESSIKGGTGHAYSPLFKVNKKAKLTSEEEQKADELGLSSEDYLQIKKLRDSKLKRVKGAKL